MTTISCTACHGVVAKDLEIHASSSTEIQIKFAVKCPHCKVLNRIEVSTRLEKYIAINGRPLELGTGEPRGDEHSSVRTLSG